MIDTTLENATTMSMSGYFDTMSSDSIVDELIVFWWKVIQAFLNDVVAVEI